MSLYIFLNGPARSGKDTIKDELRKFFKRFEPRDPFFKVTASDMLQVGCASLYSIDWDEWSRRYNSSMKDSPWDKLFGLSQREAMISIAETHLKPLHGNDVMSKILINRLKSVTGEYVFLLDIGFQEEYDYYLEELGIDNCVLVHVEKDGKTYDGDSRSHVTPRGERTFKIRNNGSISDLISTIEASGLIGVIREHNAT